MSLFQRTIRLMVGAGALAALGVGGTALALARQLIRPTRRPLHGTPRDVGLDYAEVEFPAQDGVRLSGWFISGGGPGAGPAVLVAHGWRWNRLGTGAESWADNVASVTPVNVLPLVQAIHQLGYHVLLFDLRNHGRSAAAPPVSFGLQEANDILGAAAYLRTRPDVDAQRLGALGFSMGANAILFALPHALQLRGAVLVQPFTPAFFVPRFARDLFGPWGRLVLALAQPIYRAAGGPPWRVLNPRPAAAAAACPLLYLQGQHDRWGSPEDVEMLAAAAPQGLPPLLADVADRYSGYRVVIHQPRLVTDFLWQNV